MFGSLSLILYTLNYHFFYRKATITVEANVLPSLTYISMEEWPADVGQQKIESAGQSLEVSTCMFKL